MSLIEVVPVGSDWFRGRRVWKLARAIWRGATPFVAARAAGIDPRSARREVARLARVSAIPSRPFAADPRKPR